MSEAGQKGQNPAQPVIIARDLYKRYAGFAPVLRGANIEIMPGEMAAIMGPSGCGKSTMLHILGMLHAPDSGSLEIMGRNVLNFDREQTAAFRRGNMGFVMQASNLFDHSTVFENVEFPLIYENVPQEERWERVIRALELVRLSQRVHYRSNRLSGGEQQRAAIARAMVNNPRILLADEPTGALDARTSKLIMENFSQLCHNGGVSMVMVTHDPKMADYCDSIYTLEEGQLVNKKRSLPDLPQTALTNFLEPPRPAVRGAFVARRFPDPARPQLLAQAEFLGRKKLLARICSLSSGNYLGNPEGYTLPLAIRNIGWRQKLAAFSRFFYRGKGQSLWPLLRAPGGGFAQAKSIAAGSLLARFGKEDGIDFVMAAGPGPEAASVWAAARLLGRPWSLTVPGDALADFKPGWLPRLADASLVVCRSKEGMARLKELAPLLDADKILLVRQPLPSCPNEDEAPLPAPPDKPLEILAMDDGLGINCARLLLAARTLKNRGIDFSLKIAAKKTVWRRIGLKLRGLGAHVVFLGQVAQDQRADLFKTADIFVSSPPPPGKGAVMEASLALLMAMAFGRAALAPDWPGIAEIVDSGKNGVLYAPKNPLALAEALLEICRNTRLRASLGEAARAAMQTYIAESEAGNLLVKHVTQAITVDTPADKPASHDKKGKTKK